MQNNIKKEFGPITVDSVAPSPYTKGGVEIAQAQIRQTVTTSYPSTRVGNSMSDAIFGAEDFGFAEGQTYTSERVTWLNVPADKTVKDVQLILSTMPNARIWAMFSNDFKQVMTEEQHNAVATGQQTFEFFEDKLRVRDRDGNDLAGFDELGKAQYRANGFSKTEKEDIDLRTYKGTNSTVITATKASNLQLATVGGEEDQDGLGGQ